MNLETNKMTFFDHVNELRNRVLVSIFFITVFSVISYFYSSKIIDFLLEPAKSDIVDFQVLKITSLFLVKLGVSFISGFLFSFPFIVFQILKFILPAFNKLSVNKIIIFTVISYALFLVGLIFGYKVILPLSISFFTKLSFSVDYVSLNYTLENYLSYISWILVVSSLVFQLPFVLIIVVKFGLISLETLISYRRHMIVAFFILGALLTPPDPISQISIVIPLCLLFEFSIIFIRIFNSNE